MKLKSLILVLLIVFSAGNLFAVEDICYVCHNSPQLKDDRPCTAWADHGHPINVKPSRKTVIPPDFPLNDRGEIVCNTCHVVYEDISKDTSEKNAHNYSGIIYLRYKNIDSLLCKKCHLREGGAQLRPDTQKDMYDFVVDESSDTEEGVRNDGVKINYNHPVDITSMRIPRRFLESGGGTRSQKDRIICETCHRAHQAPGKPLLAMDNEKSFLCGSCHGMQFAKDRIASSKKGTHPVNVKPSTAFLSEDLFLLGGIINSDGEIVCLTCHAVHGAVTKKSLLLKENIQSSLCMECHKGKMQSIQNTKHDIGKLFPYAQNNQGQTPSESGLCGTCHLTHGGSGPKMWAQTIEKKEEAITDLCKSCHAAGKIAENRLIGLHTHPVGINLKKLKEDAPRYSWLPLYSKFGIPKGQGNITCATCHNPHRWDPDYETPPPDALKVEGDETNSFLRMKDTNSKLCLFCHRKQKLVEKTAHDSRTAFYNSNKPAPGLLGMDSKPVTSPPYGVCRTCHIPHQAQGVRLWSRELGPGNDPISQICSSCHQDGYVASEKQVGKITHPNNVFYAKSFPIKLPLYNKKLEKTENGKILCITCHNVHRWNSEIAQGGDGTRKEGTPADSFLRISANSREKSLCDDCHIDQQWIKNTEHDLAVTVPEEIDAAGRTPRQAGVCFACHAVHNAPNKMVLWNRKLGPGKNKITAMCNSCHYKGKNAQAKTLNFNSHPVEVSTFSILDSVKSTSLPIFNENFERITESREKLAPIFFAEDPESKAKVESIKMYFRVLRRKYLSLRKKMPKMQKSIEAFMKKIKKKAVWIAQQKDQRGQIQKKINDSVTRYKKLEFKLTLLKAKLRLLEATSTGTRTGESYSSLDRLREKHKKMETSYKNTEKYFKTLYKNMKEIRKKYWKELDWIEAAWVKVDRVKKRYIKLIDTYKINKKKLEDLIAKIRGKKRNLKIDLAKIDSLGQVFKDKDFLKNMSKQELVRKLFEFRQKYLDMLRNMEELKSKTEDIRETAKRNTKSSVLKKSYYSIEDEYLAKERKAMQIARKNLDLDYHIAKSFDDSDVKSMEELGQKFQGKMFCNTCHDLHRWNPRKNDFGPGKPVEGGNADSFLRIANDFGSALCIECHKKMEIIEGTEHDLRISAPKETNFKKQTARSGGVCSSCHLVHNAADFKMLWAKPISHDKEKDTISLLCGTCHDKKGCASTKTIGENTHPISVRIPKAKELESKKETWAKFKALEEIAKDDLEKSIKHFEKKKKNAKRIKTAKKKKKKRKRKKKKKKVASSQKKVSDELEIKKISVYPLFTSNGNRDDENGSIFCSTCHNVHQWNPSHKKKGPEKPVEGTLADSFLRDNNLTRPTLCINCHSEKKSVLGTMHDLAVTAPGEKNIEGQTVLDSGTCGACHLVHNAAGKNNLWARSLGPNHLKGWNKNLAIEDDKTVQVCTGCHSEKGIASNNLPESGLHFNQMYIVQKEVKHFLKKPAYPYFDYVFNVMRKRLGIAELYLNNAKPKIPLYSPKGKIMPTGNIVCATCHNVHQWSAGKNYADSKNPGTFSTSFLRSEVASGFCTDCHGYDAIYLFAYYHKKRITRTSKRTDKNPHWKSIKVAGACNDCHNNKGVKREKHPSNIKITSKKKNIKKPDIDEEFPMDKGIMDCPTCHSKEIQQQKGLRADNPFFLRGQFYTSRWKNEARKRSLLYAKNTRGQTSTGFGGIGAVNIRRSTSPRSQTGSPGGQSSPSTTQIKNVGPPSKEGTSSIGPPAQKSWEKKTGTGKGEKKKLPDQTFQRNNSPRLEGGKYHLNFYSWKRLIFSPWRNLFRFVENAVERFGCLISNVFRVERYLKKMFVGKIFRFRHGGFDISVGSTSSVETITINPEDDNSPEEFPAGTRLYAQVDRNRGANTRRSYQSPYFQEKGQQGAPKAGKVKRTPKPAKTKEKEAIEDDLDQEMKDIFGGTGFGRKAKEPARKVDKERTRAGPRKDMIPRVTEEMLRARRKRMKKRKKKKITKKPPPPKLSVVLPVPSTGLLVWTSDESALFTPNRYTLCYECHIMEEYKQFNPHVNQIGEDDKLNTDMCILCHTQVPNRKTIDQSQFYLRDEMGRYCIGCHIGMLDGHPGGETHYGRNIPSEYRKRINNLITSSILYIPTADNKLVCSSCHNSHEKGVILKRMAARGADEKGRLRFFGYETCNACHKGVTTPTDVGSPF